MKKSTKRTLNYVAGGTLAAGGATAATIGSIKLMRDFDSPDPVESKDVVIDAALIGGGGILFGAGAVIISKQVAADVKAKKDALIIEEEAETIAEGE